MLAEQFKHMPAELAASRQKQPWFSRFILAAFVDKDNRFLLPCTGRSQLPTDGNAEVVENCAGCNDLATSIRCFCRLVIVSLRNFLGTTCTAHRGSAGS